MQVKAIGTDLVTGINAHASAVMSFDGGAQAVVTT